ncbi:hypothetical protein BGW38_006862, partial [Lunasporangiospora selenospora]
MFAWTPLTDSLDNTYEELDSAGYASPPILSPPLPPPHPSTTTSSPTTSGLTEASHTPVLQSTAPSSLGRLSTPQGSAPPALNSLQLMPRSASTPHINLNSSGLQQDASSFSGVGATGGPGPGAATGAGAGAGSATTGLGSRNLPRTSGVGTLSEASSPMMGATSSATRPFAASKLASESISSGLRSPPGGGGGGGGLGTSGGGGDTLVSSHRSSSFAFQVRPQPPAPTPQPTLSLDPPSFCWWYPRKRASMPDFVLISEFSEVEGPRAVMTIPDNIVDLTRDSYASHKQKTPESTTTLSISTTSTTTSTNTAGGTSGSPLTSGKQPSQHPQEASDSTLGPDSGSSVQDSREVDEAMFDVHEFVLRITSVDHQVREGSGGFHIPEDIEVHISDIQKGYWAY